MIEARGNSRCPADAAEGTPDQARGDERQDRRRAATMRGHLPDHDLDDPAAAAPHISADRSTSRVRGPLCARGWRVEVSNGADHQMKFGRWRYSSTIPGCTAWSCWSISSCPRQRGHRTGGPRSRAPASQLAIVWAAWARQDPEGFADHRRRANAEGFRSCSLSAHRCSYGSRSSCC